MSRSKLPGKLPKDERLLDLLVQRATEGLSEAEAAELAREHPELVDRPDDEIALAAADVDLAFTRWIDAGKNDKREEADNVSREPMPEALRRKVQADAERFLAGGSVEDRPPVDELGRRRVLREQASRGPRWIDLRLAGWYAAAAVLFIVLVVQLWPTARTPVPGNAELRQQLLETAPDVMRVAWNPPQDERFRAVEGDVVWSNSAQSGFMRLRGMPGNRPDREQYQLWIVDPLRDEHPIDGGVFDIPGGTDEVIVPIVAKLEVNEPKAFAITLEQPGGVVVSSGPLLVVAVVEG